MIEVTFFNKANEAVRRTCENLQYITSEKTGKRIACLVKSKTFYKIPSDHIIRVREVNTSSIKHDSFHDISTKADGKHVISYGRREDSKGTYLDEFEVWYNPESNRFGIKSYVTRDIYTIHADVFEDAKAASEKDLFKGF